MLDAIVVLPDHLHAVMTMPQDDADFSGRWRRIKALFARSLGVSPWQSRFWEHTIRDEGDFARHVDYIHYNPVKHGLVPAVVEWPHSSFHRYVRAGILSADWGGSTAADEGQFGEPSDK